MIFLSYVCLFLSELSNLYNMVIKFYLLWKLCEPEPDVIPLILTLL